MCLTIIRRERELSTDRLPTRSSNIEAIRDRLPMTVGQRAPRHGSLPATTGNYQIHRGASLAITITPVTPLEIHESTETSQRNHRFQNTITMADRFPSLEDFSEGTLR